MKDWTCFIMMSQVKKTHGYLEILTSKPRKITLSRKKMAKVHLGPGKEPEKIASLSNSGRRKIIHYSQNWRGMFSGYSWTKPSSFWRGRQFSGDRITLGNLVREDQQGQTKGTLLLRLSAVRKKVAATLCKLQSTRSKCCMAKPLVLKLADS